MTNDWQKHHQNGMNLPDTPLLESLYGATTIGQARDQLGAILELSGPAPLPVALRALADPDFAKKLIAVRKFPVWRDQLLQDPGNAAFDALEEQVSSEELNGRPVGTTLQLLKKGSQALLRWGASGFKLAEKDVVERRKAACLRCDQLRESPDSIPYQVARLFAGRDRRTCAACGCVVSRKILMATEACPLSDPGDSRFSRWGEPRAF